MKHVALAAMMAVLVPASAAGDSAPAPAAITVTLGGDMIGPYAVRPDANGDAGLQAVAALFRGADIGFANQEGSIFDLDGFTGHAASENGGGYPLAPAAVAKTMRAFGITLVSKANNHATDFGTDGLIASLNTLDMAGIVHAGAGDSPDAACAPTYTKTRGGLVALVSVATTFPPMAVAQSPIKTRASVDVTRPGICAIHTRLVELVTPAHLAALRAAAGSAAFAGGHPAGDLRIGDQIFRAARTPGHLVEADPEDSAAVFAAVGAAHARGALVMLAVHAHETAGNVDPIPPVDFEPLLLHRANEAPSADDPRPAAFEPTLFHGAIEAGADIVVRTGPHSANGIELYRGKPIFWGMGSLFFAFGGRRSYTAPGGQVMHLPDAWFRSIVATVRFQQGRLTGLEVRPIAIRSSTMADDGEPALLTGPAAGTALREMRDRSAALGGHFVISGTALRLPDAGGH